MEVKFMRRLTESHIDALYEAMEERMMERMEALENNKYNDCLLYTSPSPRD